MLEELLVQMHSRTALMHFNVTRNDMARNILLLTGSPRKNGNTDLLAQAFAKGAVAAGHNVETFDAGRASINGCKACDTCWSTGHPCTFKDDFRELGPLLEKADTLVFASPLYWYDISAQLKAAIDKFYAYSVESAQRRMGVKDCALLMCGMEEEPKQYDGAVISYRLVCSYKEWNDLGVVIAGGTWMPGDIAGNGALERAEQLGKSI